METITVRKSELLETVTRNRDEHRGLFLKAQERYREAVIKELDQMLADARANKKIKRMITLPEPQDYTSSYNTVIDMLAWHTADTVELERHDFERYVLNKWEWAGAFAANTQSYLSES